MTQEDKRFLRILHITVEEDSGEPVPMYLVEVETWADAARKAARIAILSIPWVVSLILFAAAMTLVIRGGL